MESPKVQSLAHNFFLLYINEESVPTIPMKSTSILTVIHLGLGGEIGPINHPQQMRLPHRREPPSTFSVFLRGRHRLPNSPGHRRPRSRGFPFDTTFNASSHCREAANTARRLLLLVRRSISELSKTAFTPLYCALVRPHQEYAMEAYAPILTADINQL